MTIEHKTVVLEQAAVDQATGEGTGYGAVFGNKDDGGDIILPGFFEPALPAFLKSGFYSWQHDWSVPVAMPTRATEDQHGLATAWKYHSTAAAQDARTITAERLANGQTMGLSIGYEVDQEEQTPTARLLIKAKRLFEVGFVMVPMNQLAGVNESKSAKQAIAPHSTATVDEPWDGNTNERHLSNDAGGPTYRRAFAWVDPEADPDTKSAYKFLHHMVSADGTVGAANLIACSTGIGVLNGGRVGTTIPEGDHQGVYNHLAKHLRDADRTPPELRGLILGPGLAYADALDLVLGEARALVERTDERLAIRSKEGRVLSSANRELIAEVAKLLNELLDRTTPEPKSSRRNIDRLRLNELMAQFDIRAEEIN